MTFPSPGGGFALLPSRGRCQQMAKKGTTDHHKWFLFKTRQDKRRYFDHMSGLAKWDLITPLKNSSRVSYHGEIWHAYVDIIGACFNNWWCNFLTFTNIGSCFSPSERCARCFIILQWIRLLHRSALITQSLSRSSVAPKPFKGIWRLSVWTGSREYSDCPCVISKFRTCI